MATMTTTGETKSSVKGLAPLAPACSKVSEVSATTKSIMARFWYSCAVFCAAALLMPLFTQSTDDRLVGGLGDADPEADAEAAWAAGPSQSVQVGVIFFAIAVMVWTFIAAWFCYNSPLLLADVSGRKRTGLDSQLDVSRSVLQRVAQGFADFIVENSKREDRMGSNGEATSSLRGLDLVKFEELVAVAPAAAASALYGYKGAPTPKEMFTKECCRQGTGTSCACKVQGDTADAVPQLDAPHLSLFKELLKDRLVANLMFEGGQKLGENGSEGSNWCGNLRLPSRWFAQSSEPPKSVGDDHLESLVWSLLASSEAEEEASSKTEENRQDDVPFAASMADHARTIGDKCFKEGQFVAAVHCYEVATLLCPSGPGSPFREQLAAGHCNCALACLKLRRYGDAISECHAALVLVPSMQLTMKTLHRLTAAHVCLKNFWEAKRCLRNCLDLEPENVPVLKLLDAVEEAAQQQNELTEDRCELVWADLCIQGGRDKARKRRGKKKCFGSGDREERHLDREAGLWHSMVEHNSKLYVFGGLSSGRDADVDAPGTGGALGPHQMENNGGSEEFHVLDLETLEMGIGCKVPRASYCHTATVVGNSMLVLGGSTDGVLVYDFLDSKWRSPSCSGGPGRRQNHSATAVAHQLLVYGGVELMEQGNGRVCNDAYLLDTESWAWKKLECTGTIPAARFGHTATWLSSHEPSSQLLIIGGRDQMTSCRELVRDHTGLQTLDVASQVWSEQAFSGAPPEKVFGHFACLWNSRTLLLLSGEANDKPQPTTGGVELFLLDLQNWFWSQPSIQGASPPPRLGLAAASTGSWTGALNERRIYLFGGVVLRGDQVMVDKSVYMLETVEAKEAKAAAAAKELDDAPTAEPDNEVEQETNGSHLVPEPGDVPTDLPDDGDQNEEVEDEPELSFEELLEQEKAFFKLQSKKTSFPRSQVAAAEVRRKDNRQAKKSGQKSG